MKPSQLGKVVAPQLSEAARVLSPAFSGAMVETGGQKTDLCVARFMDHAGRIFPPLWGDSECQGLGLLRTLHTTVQISSGIIQCGWPVLNKHLGG